MKFSLPPGTFPPLELSDRRRRSLVAEAQRVVDETVEANEAFLAEGRVFRQPEWKLVRTKEGVQVYQQRTFSARELDLAADTPLPPTPDGLRAKVFQTRARSRSRREQRPKFAKIMTPNNTATVSSSEFLSDDGSGSASAMGIVEAMKRPHIPLMALIGSLEGSLHDTMYGIFADDDLSWRWRSSHVNDRFDDAKILAKLTGPTERDPFRFVGVKWFAKEHPAVLSSFVQRRDFLIIEASGLTKDSAGETVGYMLMHSVALPTVPELTELGVIRGCLSFCYLVRERENSTVEIYCRGFTDPMGDMMERVSVAIAAEALICAVAVVDYAYIKKLTWFAKKHQRRARRRVTQRGSSSNKLEFCECCNKSLSVLGGILSASTSACQICRRVVCTKCSVLKKMTVDVSLSSSTQKTLRFCVECMLQAKEYSAWEIASRAVAPPLPQPPAAAAQQQPMVLSVPSQLLTPRRQISEPLPRSRTARAYSERAPAAQFFRKGVFPPARVAEGGRGNSRVAKDHRDIHDIGVGNRRNDVDPAAEQEKTPITRHSERIPFHAVL